MTSPHQTDMALDPDLMAYIDGQLDPDRMAEIEARLARDAEARDAVAQWRHMNNLLHSHGQSADDLPDNLKIAALERQLAAKLKRQHWRAVMLGSGLRRIAAGAVLFVAGWGSHALYSVGGAVLDTASHPYFVAPTLAGHTAYTLAMYRDGEVEETDIEAALDWMSAQMQLKIDNPKLERLGYEVQSARLMMVKDRPVAVFYYRNPDDQRVTVSMTPKAPEHKNHALRVVDVDNAVMAYWTSSDLHYTIVANSSRGTITTLAAAVQQ